jgi:hypothetical protein
MNIAMPRSPNPPQALSTVFGPVLAQRQPVSLTLRVVADVPSRGDAAAIFAPAKRRAAIWDMHNSMHCSIIGTCLSTAELRHLLVKLKIQGAEIAGDHDLHMLGVMLAGRPRSGAKLLQKTLDKRHAAAIKQAAKLKQPAELIAFWNDALKRGEIPGAYWAVLSHPAADDDVMRRAFGDVHMLSHLVGAANRADIRRLRALEEENAALAVKIERQQRQLRDGFVSRDRTIRRLEEALAQARPAEPLAEPGADARLGETRIGVLEARLAVEVGRRERTERQLERLSASHRAGERRLRETEAERDALAQELASIEARLAALLDDAPAAADLGGMSVLYVGGRARLVPQLKALIERAGASLLHHDGGLEHNANLLPGLVSRANLVLFPVDCVSHDAATVIKRLCRQAGKRYVPLRSASLASCLSALARMAEDGPVRRVDR